MDPSELALIQHRVRGGDLYKALTHLLAELPEDTTITIRVHHRIVRAMDSWDELGREQDRATQKEVFQQALAAAQKEGK